MFKIKITPLEWSEKREPNNTCAYDHVVADSIFGTYTIEWKSWKDESVVAFLNGRQFLGAYDSIEEAKNDIQRNYEDKILSVVELTESQDHSKSLEGKERCLNSTLAQTCL